MSNGNTRLPSLDLLRGFEAAARLLSFTRAGEELHLTQSAVSRQIQELETQLGTPLFERRHRSLALTEAGRQFYATAAQVLATMRAATDRLRAQSGRRALAVTTTHSFAALWLIPRLAGFTRAHPAVDVRISADTRVQDLERDGLDVAIRHGPPSLAGPDAERLFGERVFPVCNPKLLQDKARPLKAPADLRAPPVAALALVARGGGAVRAQARGPHQLLGLRADHRRGGRRPRRRARQDAAPEGRARLGRAGGAVQAQRRSGARLLRGGLADSARAAGGGRLHRLAEGRS